MAQSRSYLYATGPNVSIVNILGALKLGCEKPGECFVPQGFCYGPLVWTRTLQPNTWAHGNRGPMETVRLSGSLSGALAEDGAVRLARAAGRLRHQRCWSASTHVEVRGTYHWLHECSYGPLIKPLSRVSQVISGI